MLYILNLLIAEVTEPRVRRGEMTEEAATAISATQQPRNCHRLIDSIAVDSYRPHRVGVVEGHIGRLEVLEGFQRSSMIPQTCLPVVGHFSFNESLECSL